MRKYTDQVSFTTIIMLFNPANTTYWIFLGIGVLLFLFVIVSGGTDEDIDVDSDVDVDADVDFDGEGNFNLGLVLGWAGIGKAPLILLLATDLSLWGLFGWMLNVWLGGILNQVPSGIWSSIVLFLSLLFSLFTGGLIARPMGRIFAEFGEDTSSDRLIGLNGTVSSASIPVENQGRIGQIDIIDRRGNLVTVNATIPKWATVIPHHGDKVIVIDRQQDIYCAIAQDSPDVDHWLRVTHRK
ncbi:MAG: DUF1449 family protein [Calothrix sp. MO_167.B12]|nr:DUF1449 family protein [Calothrix sp. MO_167.B12]